MASLLLHDDFDALAYFADDDVWFDHLRPVTATIRALHVAGKPSGLVFTLYALGPILDELNWRGEQGEVLLVELLSRHLADPQPYYGVALAKLVHHYAERRRGVQRAQGAAVQAYNAALQPNPRKQYEGEL